MQKGIFTISVLLILLGSINYSKAQCTANWGFSNVTDIQPKSFTANWTSGGAGATYDVLIKEAYTFSNFYEVASGITGLSYTVANLAPGKNYYVRIVRHCGGTTDWSTSPNNITTVDFTPGIVYCFGYWYGAKSYLPHARKIDVNWAGGDGANYYVLYKDNGYFSDWIKRGPFTGSSYTISGLEPSTSYYVKIQKDCQGNISESSFPFSITTYAAECDEPNIILKKLVMVDVNTAEVQIYFSTNYSSNNTYSGSIYKKQAGSQDVLYSNIYLNAEGTYTFYLPAGAGYEFRVASHCGSNGLYSSTKSFEVGTFHNEYVSSCLFMNNVVATHKNVTSNSAIIDYARTIYIDQYHTYYLAYKIAGTENWTTKLIVADQDINHSGYVPMNFTGLQPNTTYQYAVVEKVKLKPGMLCSGGIVETFQFSNTGAFTTLGPCNSTGGDFNAPAYTNSAESLFYSGTISSASPVTQSSKQLQFTASSVQLNPGFVTTVSGSGSFIARGYNFTTCQAAARFGMQNTVNDTLTAKAAKKTFVTLYASKPASIKDSLSIMVYPNPTSGNINFQLQNSSEYVRQIIVTDILGRTVKAINENVKTINVAELTPGVYFYKVVTNNGTYSGKIQKR